MFGAPSVVPEVASGLFDRPSFIHSMATGSRRGPKYPPLGEECQGSSSEGTGGLVPAGAGAWGTALHPPNQPLDMSDYFRHPPLDLVEFQQALSRFHLMHYQTADSIDKCARDGERAT